MKRQEIKKVLDLKELTKDQLEIEVKQHRDELEADNKKLKSMGESFKKARDDFSVRQDQRIITIQELELFYNYFLYMNKQIEKQKQTVIRKNADIEEKQYALLDAYKEKRLYEILHDKIIHEETKESLMVEQKEADFHFISRKTRR